MKLSSAPRSLHIRWSFKPKNRLMEPLPRWAMPLRVLGMCILRFLHTRGGVLSTTLMPVHLPGRTSFMNRASGMATSSSDSGEAVVGEQMPHIPAHLIQIEVLQAPIPGIVEKCQYEHNLGLRHG